MITPVFKKKKASDYYFKKSNDKSNKKIIHSIDFMSEDKIHEVQ